MESVSLREDNTAARGAGSGELAAVPAEPVYRSTLCAAAMVLGIAAVVVPFAELLLSVPALVLAVAGLRKARRQPVPYAGKGMAVAGLVLGFIGLAMCVPSVIILAQII
jgi:hypothetical protein